jgi:hypothetical protein
VGGKNLSSGFEDVKAGAPELPTRIDNMCKNPSPTDDEQGKKTIYSEKPDRSWVGGTITKHKNGTYSYSGTFKVGSQFKDAASLTDEDKRVLAADFARELRALIACYNSPYPPVEYVKCNEDADGDYVTNAGDNCCSDYNPDQLDSDYNGIGDACQAPTDVAVSSFTATGYGQYVVVEWSTKSEIDNAGFNLYRSPGTDAARVRVNSDMIPARGAEYEGSDYSFTDYGIARGVTYIYWLESVKLSGVGNLLGSVVASHWREETPIPARFRLAQNDPNPFNLFTQIRYDLPEDCRVRLDVYNVLGERVVTLVDEHQQAGSKTVHWDGRDSMGAEIPGGVYFYRLEAGSYFATRKMVVPK